ncbi:LysR family transcriptional regulator [Qipengyuania sediminis]|uniref:LysR family transcriptional regulator n=1 Tax=Qipengyuania sediminis TaxID=1532023 RepID=UPI00105A2666|nr:LysR substrate-binding domain-containing protein [Qipengyuania sediminis]
MNLRHIEVFHAVYVNGSVSAAARMLNVSQPSVSKVLRHAESLLGFPLFHRTAGRLVATADAHALFGEVAEIQDRVGALREATRNLKRGSGALLRISALPSLALDALPATVASFLKTNPEVRFDLQTIHHADLLRKLYERETDLAIAYEVPTGSALGHRRLGSGELVVLYREADLPDAPARIDLAELAGRPLVSLAASGPIGQLFTAEVAARGIALDEVISARTFHIATALVRHGVGLTVVDSFTARASLTDGLAMRPLAQPLRFDVNALYLQDRPPAMLATRFLKALAQRIEARTA